MSHFNDKAAEWDNQEKIQLMAVLAKKTQQALNLKGPIDIMDFGCGTGLYGLELADFAKSLVGVDTSEGMLEVFDKKTEAAENISSKLVDLEKETFNQKFDLIVSSMAFHHLNDPGKMIQTLKSLLNPGGRLAIVDLDKEDGTFHPDNEGMGVRHHGFSKQEIESWASDAAMQVNHQIINELEKNDKTYGQFLAIFE